jgi:uncharacterized OB-fold protein
MAAVAQRPIAAGVFTWPSEAPQLIGSACAACGVVTFPTQSGCPRCGAEAMQDRLLARRGTLWTWTSQDFLPKPPYAGPETDSDFGGYLLGYVELPDGVRVETRLVGLDRADVHIGMELELCIVPFRTDPDGTEVLAYAFGPVTPGGGE